MSSVQISRYRVSGVPGEPLVSIRFLASTKWVAFAEVQEAYRLSLEKMQTGMEHYIRIVDVSELVVPNATQVINWMNQLITSAVGAATNPSLRMVFVVPTSFDTSSVSRVFVTTNWDEATEKARTMLQSEAN